jgi:RNA-binding protein NOB1
VSPRADPPLQQGMSTDGLTSGLYVKILPLASAKISIAPHQIMPDSLSPAIRRTSLVTTRQNLIMSSETPVADTQKPIETVFTPMENPEVQAPSTSTTTPPKSIHTLILDAGPLIKNDPPVSTLLSTAEELYTLPSVISEIKDEATRLRVNTQLLPFLKLRSPKPESVNFVVGFARRTGDLEVLSKPDLHLIALAYELECERNHGDWRLRNTPAQKGLNGKSPAQKAREEAAGEDATTATAQTAVDDADTSNDMPTDSTEAQVPAASEILAAEETTQLEEQGPPSEVAQEQVSHQLDSLTLEAKQDNTEPADLASGDAKGSQDISGAAPEVAEDDDDDDEEGWITPENLKQQQTKDQASAPEQPIQRVLQVALLTSDYAMQNVLLRINLNLVSPTLARITRVKTWVLRCHGCFQITRQMDKQFCPRCGQPTLTRVSCSTDQSGNFQVHLKKNFQWNNRGNVYSVPKPVHGTSNGKDRGQGGGKGGWGRELLLAEDQKEYTMKVNEDKRTRQRDLMDEDYLPGILSGRRQGGGGGGGRLKVGAGRNVNSKKRN